MGLFSTPVPSVSVIETESKMHNEGAVLIDVRNPDEFSGGHALGAKNMPLPSLSAYVDDLKKYSHVYVICQSGGRSASAVSTLRSAHIPAVNVSGGTGAWRAHGLPIA